MGRPYRETRVSEDVMIREFSERVASHELEWHMDRRNREVKVLEGEGWKLQMQEGLPFDMIPGHTYMIPRESWHRIIRGDQKLRIMILEH